MSLYLIDNPWSCAGYYLIQAKDKEEAIEKAKQQLKLIKFKGETDGILKRMREIEFDERGVNTDLSQVG